MIVDRIDLQRDRVAEFKCAQNDSHKSSVCEREGERWRDVYPMTPRIKYQLNYGVLMPAVLPKRYHRVKLAGCLHKACKMQQTFDKYRNAINTD